MPVEFKWGKDGSRPDLEPHSATKLEVLHDYIVEYLKILVSNAMGKEEFKITFVDAFAQCQTIGRLGISISWWASTHDIFCILLKHM